MARPGTRVHQAKRAGQGTALVPVAGEVSSAPVSAPIAFRGGALSQVRTDGEALLEVWLAGKDSKTIRAYRSDLGAFARFAGFGQVEAALDAFAALSGAEANAVALRYRGALLEAGLAPATVNRRLAALRSVVKLARLLGRVSWALEVPGVEATAYRDTRGPGVDGFRAMLGAVAEREDAKGLRDRALLRLMFDMALRRGEVTGLDVEHYDRAVGTLSVLGKKRRERARLTVPVPTRQALDAWLRARGEEPGPLFVALDPANRAERAGGLARLTGRSVARIVAAAGEAGGVAGVVRPHGLRHAAITHMLTATGGNVSQVARFSRHRDVRTVELYNDNRADVYGELAALAAAVA